MISGVVLPSFLSCTLMLRFATQPVASEATQRYLPVPFHYQDTGYYCGPASLEMVFNFYGPDIPQTEIADAARTGEEGTSLDDMVRAAHFSNLSTSVGDALPWNITGYSERKLGYAAFARQGISLDELKSLIAAGYPIIVATQYSREWPDGHYRVIVGYNETHITFHDPWFNAPYEGPNVNVSYSEFLSLWQFSDYWGLFVSPWNISISAPENVGKNDVFNVAVTVTYPCPPPFTTDEYSASSLNTTITLSDGLELLPGEPSKKPVSLEYLYPGNSVTINWTLRADKPGDYVIAVESEGKITGFVPYTYEDRIGGSGNTTIHVQEASATIPGDVNHDGTVNILDIVAIASIYGCKEGDPNFNPEADLAPPYGVINMLDLVTCAYHYGQKYR